MKKLLTILLLVGMLFSIQTSRACHFTEVSFSAPLDNLDGTYTITVTTCLNITGSSFGNTPSVKYDFGSTNVTSISCGGAPGLTFFVDGGGNPNDCSPLLAISTITTSTSIIGGDVVTTGSSSGIFNCTGNCITPDFAGFCDVSISSNQPGGNCPSAAVVGSVIAEGETGIIMCYDNIFIIDNIPTEYNVLGLEDGILNVANCEVVLSTGASACSDNGTPNNPTDDFFTMTILSDGVATASTTNLAADNTVFNDVTIDGIVFKGPFTSAPCSSLLPLSLLDFSGKSTKQGNQLSWTTTDEIDVDYIVLEKSLSNSRDFQMIHKEMPKGAEASTSVNIYEYLDADNESSSYYRLKIMDKDGSYEYSEIIELNRKTQDFQVLNVFPVPTKQTADVQFETNDEQTVRVAITDMTGRRVMSDAMNAHSGINTYQADMSNLPNGVYYITLDNGANRLIEKLVKN